MRVRTLLLSIILSAPIFTFSQSNNQGIFSGNFQSSLNFYQRDDKIGANTEVYRKAQSSLDAWLFLNYNYNGFNFSARFDGFQNSPLLDPQGMYTKQGLGFWQVSKDVSWLNLTAGHFYEQFGSGMLFRAYEDKNIGIDYAVQGFRVKATPVKDLRITGFSGQQKGNIFTSDRFGVSPQIISGANVEYRIPVSSFGINSFDIGASAINRVLDNTTLNKIVSEINSYPLDDRFNARFNMFGFNGYGTIDFNGLILSGEYNIKSEEPIMNEDGSKLISAPGSALHVNASYSKGRFGENKQMSFGANAQYKRVGNFRMRTSPYETLLNGNISYLPSITKQNSYRLLARYNSVVQELGEQAYQADFIFTPKRGTSISVNLSHVESLDANGKNGKAEKLFEEVYVEIEHKFKKTTSGKQWAVKGGVQSIFYNQDKYEMKPGYENVKAITPFGEATYKYTRRNSLRLEAQYLDTKQDLGSFVNAILEWNIASKWSFALGDMVNVVPERQAGSTVSDEIIHYYTVFSAYTMGATQFTLAYIKQVEGVNCTGGICRVEPAFSGVRFTLTTSF